MILERYEPDQGLSQPNGRHIPPGTSVGSNTYVASHTTAIYGATPTP